MTRRRTFRCSDRPLTLRAPRLLTGRQLPRHSRPEDSLRPGAVARRSRVARRAGAARCPGSPAPPNRLGGSSILLAVPVVWVARWVAVTPTAPLLGLRAGLETLPSGVGQPVATLLQLFVAAPLPASGVDTLRPRHWNRRQRRVPAWLRKPNRSPASLARDLPSC